MPPEFLAIIQQGTFIFATHTISARDLDGWVQVVAEESGQKVAWNRQGRIYVLGDVHKAVVAMLAAREQHDVAVRRACSSSIREGTIQWTLDLLWRPVRLLAEAFQTLEAGQRSHAPSEFKVAKPVEVEESTAVLSISLNGDD